MVDLPGVSVVQEQVSGGGAPARQRWGEGWKPRLTCEGMTDTPSLNLLGNNRNPFQLRIYSH